MTVSMGSRPEAVSSPQPARVGRAASVSSRLWLLFAALGFAIGSQQLVDNSFLTHLANGRLILESGSVPTADPYSFTAGGEPVVIQSWLASVIYAGLEASLGLWSIRVLHGILAAVVSLALWRLADSAPRPLGRLVVMVPVPLIGLYHWGARPLLFGLVGMAVVMLALERQVRVAWLVPVMWLWVNTHGSFPLGIALIMAVALGEWADQRRVPAHELRVLGWATVGVALGAINPLGLRLLLFPVALLGRRDALAEVAEWQSPSLVSAAGLLVALATVMVVVLLVRRAPWRQVVPAVVFTVAAGLAQRNIGPAAVVWVACFAPALAIGSSNDVGSPRLIRPIGGLAVALVVIGLLAVATRPAVDFGPYPQAEVDWLEARGLVANPNINLVHRDLVGNYLEARYGASARVFFDDRFDFYPLAINLDHRALLGDGPFRATLDRHHADVVLWSTSSNLGRWLHQAEGWAVVHESADWLIACRVEGSNPPPCPS